MELGEDGPTLQNTEKYYGDVTSSGEIILWQCNFIVTFVQRGVDKK